MSKKISTLIAKAKKEIENLGWTAVEDMRNENGDVHLELTAANGQRKGWGMFSQVYCWTEAYESITGKSWITLINN